MSKVRMKMCGSRKTVSSFRDDQKTILTRRTNKNNINKEMHHLKNATTTFNNRKNLKGLVKISIPKQAEDEERDRKQSKG